jgi:2-succinyl-5-enolpyruvyl-6-hydroxy-3-cyclohexene-1-carboxylate synthase
MNLEGDNVLTEWARLVAASLASAGVRDVIVSPGSRSTPFAVAIARAPGLAVTSVVDERSASFVALGIARVTGRPAAVLATSGSAPAHWLPAVIEASTANVPLLLLSADRPLALAQTGAAQTIDQTKLFGQWVRFFADLGDPRDDDASLDGVVRTIGQAVAVSCGALPGPVHLNLRADKPLEPIDRDDALHARVETRIRRGVTQVSTAASGADETFAKTLATSLAQSERPLVVVGPRPAYTAPIAHALSGLGLPVAVEASSQLRFGHRPTHAIDAFEHLFSCGPFRERHAPDLILQIGSASTSSVFATIGVGVRRFILDAGGIRDPLGGAVAISTADAAPTLARLAELAQHSRHELYARTLEAADARVWSLVEHALTGPFGEGAAVCAATNALPARGQLFIGNSLPIRTLDRFVRGGPKPLVVLSQRGTNGIDGLLAGAAGAAIASQSPVLAIVGDVSFLHDASSLLTLASVKTPVVVLVIDNGGGRIFEELPIARDPSLAHLMPLFTTPHSVDLGALAQAYGVRFSEASSASSVEAAVAKGLATAGATLVRAIVPPHEASESLAALRRAALEVLR